MILEKEISKAIQEKDIIALREKITTIIDVNVKKHLKRQALGIEIDACIESFIKKANNTYGNEMLRYVNAIGALSRWRYNLNQKL